MFAMVRDQEKWDEEGFWDQSDQERLIRQDLEEFQQMRKRKAENYKQAEFQGEENEWV